MAGPLNAVEPKRAHERIHCESSIDVQASPTLIRIRFVQCSAAIFAFDNVVKRLTAKNRQTSSTTITPWCTLRVISISPQHTSPSSFSTVARKSEQKQQQNRPNVNRKTGTKEGMLQTVDRLRYDETKRTEGKGSFAANSTSSLIAHLSVSDHYSDFVRRTTPSLKNHAGLGSGSEQVTESRSNGRRSLS